MSRGTQEPAQRASEGFAYGTVTLCGRPFQAVRLPCWLVTRRPCGQAGPTTPPSMPGGLGYVRVRSPLLAESLLFSCPPGTEMVHFPGLSSRAYGFSGGYRGITRGGLPHSEIAGSKPVCGSPTLIAAYHVLHRLLAPRHSPYALSSLTITSDFEESDFRTACAVIGNYLLKDIQLSKSRDALFGVAQSRHRSAFASHSLRSSLRRTAFGGLPAVAAREASIQRRLVENTGLEPVTSWLQTRRSPS